MSFYAALLRRYLGLRFGESARRVDSEPWRVVVTAVTDRVTEENGGDEDVGEKVVTFSERLLRSIVPLAADQQLGLCRLPKALWREKAVPKVFQVGTPFRPLPLRYGWGRASEKRSIAQVNAAAGFS